MNYYILFNQVEYTNKRRSKYTDILEPQMDKLLKMYYEDLMTFREIAKEMNVDWQAIRNFWNAYGLTKISVKERHTLKNIKNMDEKHKK